MDQQPYKDLERWCTELDFDSAWMREVCARGAAKLSNCNHGDFPRWRDALERLPRLKPDARLDLAAPEFGGRSESGPGLRVGVRDALKALHPWRKGPLQIAGVFIDTEWRSDWKWSRVGPHVELSGCKVLDIGCGNGYYGWRMLAQGADLVIGIDPTWVYVMQWLACRHFGGDLPNFVLPLAIEDLPETPVSFDYVFSMGVLYHRRDAMQHLRRLRKLLGPSGTLVLETLVLPHDCSSEVLVPRGRYARMRNVWAIPGCDLLRDWVGEAGFSRIEIADTGVTTTHEQRSTDWMTFESLAHSLDPEDQGLTVEGHPAPRRAVIIAQADRS